MGLDQRADVLARAAKHEERTEGIREAARRLVDRNGMGEQYRVFGMVGKEREVKAEYVWPFVEE